MINFLNRNQKLNTFLNLLKNLNVNNPVVVMKKINNHFVIV